MADILEDIKIPKEKKKREDLFIHEKSKKNEEKKAHYQHPAQMHHDYHSAQSGEREIVIRFKLKPFMVERIIYILIILVLAYLIFFSNKEFSFDFLTFDKEVKEAPTLSQETDEESSEATTETVAEAETQTEAEEVSTESTASTGTTATTAGFSGKLILMITDVDTKETSYGGKKITKVDYTIDNQKEKLTNTELKIFAYDPNGASDDLARTKEKDAITYSLIPVSLTPITGSKELNVPPGPNPNQMRVEAKLYNKTSSKVITQDYRNVDIS